jgi:hypothetical protein
MITLIKFKMKLNLMGYKVIISYIYKQCNGQIMVINISMD